LGFIPMQKEYPQQNARGYENVRIGTLKRKRFMGRLE